MNTENYVKCPVCGNYSAIVETQVEMDETFESRLCMKCGFTTNNELKFDSKFIELFEQQQPRIVTELKYEDTSLEQYWYPVTTHIQNYGALYPIGNKESYKWAYAKSVPIPIMERLQYPMEGKENHFHESRLAIDTAEQFETFEEAYNKFSVNKN